MGRSRRKTPALEREPMPAAPGRSASFVFYQGPGGGPSDRCHNPTAEQIVRILRELDQSWNSNIGQCWMAWHTDRRAVRLNGPPADEKSSLVFLKNRRRGWYFEYSDDSVPDINWQVPFDEARQRGRRIGHFGCEWIYLLPGCFVPVELAERIVLDFL